MASKLGQIADAVVALLNAMPVSVDSVVITAQKRYLPPRYDAAELDSPVLLVIPQTLVEAQTDTRTTQRRDYPVGIGLLQRMTDAADVAAIDALIEVAEGIADWLKTDGKRVLALATAGTASLVGTELGPLVNPGALDTHNVFFALITPTYAQSA